MPRVKSNKATRNEAQVEEIGVPTLNFESRRRITYLDRTLVNFVNSGHHPEKKIRGYSWCIHPAPDSFAP